MHHYLNFWLATIVTNNFYQIAPCVILNYNKWSLVQTDRIWWMIWVAKYFERNSIQTRTLFIYILISSPLINSLCFQSTWKLREGIHCLCKPRLPCLIFFGKWLVQRKISYVLIKFYCSTPCIHSQRPYTSIDASLNCFHKDVDYGLIIESTWSQVSVKPVTLGT